MAEVSTSKQKPARGRRKSRPLRTDAAALQHRVHAALRVTKDAKVHCLAGEPLAVIAAHRADEDQEARFDLADGRR